MFRRFLLTTSNSTPTIEKEINLFDIDVCSSNSSSNRSNCSSEQVNRSDIPTLRRRHSFVTPYAESILEEEINRTNDNADLSIDPFDTSNALKRSKSLSFNIIRRPSFSTIRKKNPKFVHFEGSEEQIKDLGNCPNLKEVSNSDETSEEEKNIESPEKSQSSFYLDSTGNKIRNDQVNHTSMDIYRSQENEIQRRYSLFLEDSMVPELESENCQINENKVFEDKSLNLTTSIRYDPAKEVSEKLSDSENDNSCLFTEYSQENQGYQDYMEDKQNGKKRLECSVEEEEGLDSDQSLMMRRIFQNLSNIEISEMHTGDFDTSDMSLKLILICSENAKNALSQRNIEIALLKSKLMKYESEKLEKDVILGKCESLKKEIKSCNTAKELVSSKYNLLLSIKDELETNGNILRKNKNQLEVDLSNSASRLQAELDSRKELFALINKYDNSEEISDKSDNLKGYIEQLLLKNESIVKENALILEQKVRMRDEMGTLNESLKSSLDRALEAQETLESIFDENARLKINIEELQLKFKTSDKTYTRKIDQLTNHLKDKDDQISLLQKIIIEWKSSEALMKEEKEYLQIKLSDNIADIEEANRQIKEELIFRTHMEKDYNELETKMRDGMGTMNEKIKKANELLSVKQSELSSLDDTNSKLKQQLSISQTKQKNLIIEKEDFVEENQKLVKINNDSKLAFDLLQEHIKRSNKNVDIMSKEYLLVLKSNEIVSNALKRFAMTSFQSLQPVMYEESREYFTKIYRQLCKQTLFSREQAEIIQTISQFFTQCISDVVSQYLENESLLESEVENRNNNYQKMLDKLTKIMEDSILRATDSKENMNGTGIARDLENKYKAGKENHRRGIIYKNPNQ